MGGDPSTKFSGKLPWTVAVQETQARAKGNYQRRAQKSNLQHSEKYPADMGHQVWGQLALLTPMEDTNSYWPLCHP